MTLFLNMTQRDEVISCQVPEPPPISMSTPVGTAPQTDDEKEQLICLLHDRLTNDFEHKLVDAKSPLSKKPSPELIDSFPPEQQIEKVQQAQGNGQQPVIQVPSDSPALSSTSTASQPKETHP